MGVARAGHGQRVGLEWPDLCNRREVVSRCDDGIGRVCHWSESSFLTACRVFPSTGGRLLRHAWPAGPSELASPVSVILPVRGEGRFAVVAFVADALRRMAGARSEVLICEHDVLPRYAGAWPPGVRHVFVPATGEEAFNKSKAMNAGARVARNPVLVLLDADVVPSPDFLVRSLELMGRGWEAVRPVRFLFLLDEAASLEFSQKSSLRDLLEISQVHQNFPGLATVVRREAYGEMGGHDERFEGWGGEDLEFLDRLRTRQLYPGSFLPAIHLWHAPAEQKRSGHRNNDLFRGIMQEPVAGRIERGRRSFEGGRT
jgi:hypothetical protein